MISYHWDVETRVQYPEGPIGYGTTFRLVSTNVLSQAMNQWHYQVRRWGHERDPFPWSFFRRVTHFDGYASSPTPSPTRRRNILFHTLKKSSACFPRGGQPTLLQCTGRVVTLLSDMSAKKGIQSTITIN